VVLYIVSGTAVPNGLIDIFSSLLSF